MERPRRRTRNPGQVSENMPEDSHGAPSLTPELRRKRQPASQLRSAPKRQGSAELQARGHAHCWALRRSSEGPKTQLGSAAAPTQTDGTPTRKRTTAPGARGHGPARR
eukprot:1642492-Alexandrium_andersonii.AAC.1